MPSEQTHSSSRGELSKQEVENSIRATFSTYEEGKSDVQTEDDLERLQAFFLQKAWVDMKYKKLGEADEEAKTEWMMELGEWFRNEVMEYSHTSESAKISRKDHFLSLFDADPVSAVLELEELFRSKMQS